MTTIDTPDWRDLAACATIAPDLWFSEDGTGTHAALKICYGCDVRDQCLQYAIDNGIIHGTWGAKTAGQRQRGRVAAA
jgi:WhiB family redox-sensing transcriptional regulator